MTNGGLDDDAQGMMPYLGVFLFYFSYLTTFSLGIDATEH